MTDNTYRMRAMREKMSLSLETVAAAVGCNAGTVSRVETGANGPPKRDLARALYTYYKGRVPLGAIYDPRFYAERKPAPKE